MKELKKGMINVSTRRVCVMLQMAQVYDEDVRSGSARDDRKVCVCVCLCVFVSVCVCARAHARARVCVCFCVRFCVSVRVCCVCVQV